MPEIHQVMPNRRIHAGIPFIYAAYGFGNVSSDKYIAEVDDIKNLPATHGRIVKKLMEE